MVVLRAYSWLLVGVKGSELAKVGFEPLRPLQFLPLLIVTWLTPSGVGSRALERSFARRRRMLLRFADRRDARDVEDHRVPLCR